MTDICKLVCLTLVMAGLLVRTEPAEACSLAAPVPHLVDPARQGIDTRPPPPPVVRLREIKRGQGQGGRGCASGGTSCDDLGTVAISITATDEDTPAQSIGYRFDLVSGRLPAGMTLPGDSRSLSPPDENGQVSMFLNWGDGATDDQEAFDFTLSVRAIDLAGNVSEPTMVRVSDDPSGCSLAGNGQSVPSLPLLALAVLVLAKRRRHRIVA